MAIVKPNATARRNGIFALPAMGMSDTLLLLLVLGAPLNRNRMSRI
jgi:hypothetical protein